MNAALALSPQARAVLRRARRHYAPPERMSARQWAERYRVMHSGPFAGNRFSLAATPALAGLFAAYEDPLVREIWCAKSSQLGWTQGFVLNCIGKQIHLDPCPMLVLTAKDGDARGFSRKKLEPAVKASRPLLERVPVGGKVAGSSWDYKSFPGGWLQIAGANSPGNVKSTDYKRVFVEEPDDTSRNVHGQGDAIALGRERYKAFADGKLIVGGTPTVRGLSRIWAGLERTDQRRMYVACPHCGHEQPLRWEQVRWDQDALIHHPIYGTHRPETARYECEACCTPEQPEGRWSDAQKNDAVLEASKRPDHGWRATAAFSGAAGFLLNELYSTFSESRFEVLVRKFLEAEHALDNGDDTLMRAFVNNQLGEPWEIKSNAPELDALVERGEDYALWTAPTEALVATCFVDVQRGGEQSGEARLEYLIVAWGRGLESWRVARGHALGNPLEEATWDELDRQLAEPIRSAGGGTLPITLMGVDSGDGMTQEAVLRYCRRAQRQGRDVIPTKGSSVPGKPIFSTPRALDHLHNDRASKYGLKLYLVGTDTAKDALVSRLKLTGRGPGRMHWPAAIGTDYLQQITAEVKVPGRNGKEKWEVLAGRRNEMTDCEVGNLHLAYKLRLQAMPEQFWLDVESRLRQPSLLTPTADPGAAAALSPAAEPPSTVPVGRPITGGQPFRGWR